MSRELDLETLEFQNVNLRNIFKMALQSNQNLDTICLSTVFLEKILVFFEMYLQKTIAAHNRS
jgi:hypothetical protein